MLSNFRIDNSNAEIAPDAFLDCLNLIIRGAKNSQVERFAIQAGIPFYDGTPQSKKKLGIMEQIYVDTFESIEAFNPDKETLSEHVTPDEGSIDFSDGDVCFGEDELSDEMIEDIDPEVLDALHEDYWDEYHRDDGEDW